MSGQGVIDRSSVISPLFITTISHGYRLSQRVLVKFELGASEKVNGSGIIGYDQIKAQTKTTAQETAR